MSLVFCDSFDHYDTAGLSAKYFVAPAGATISSLVPRTGIQCLVISGAFGPLIAVDQLSSMVFGTALRPDALDLNFNGDFVRFQDGGTSQIRVAISPSGAIVILRGNDPFPTTLATSAPGLVPTATYSYLEVAVTISNAGGSVEVRLNGASVLSFSGDTQETANSYATFVQLMSLGGAFWRHDDVYLLDALVAPNQTFLGAISVYACMPNADDSPLQWTPSAGLTHFNLVDEVPQSTADFVESSTPGQIDQYLYDTSAITPPVTVFAVQHSMFAGLDGPGSHNLASNIDGTTTGPVDQALTTSAVFVKTPYDQLNGVDWQLADFATTSFGPELTS